jgi:hypothetical protein
MGMDMNSSTNSDELARGKPVKILLCAHTGSGKTGASASLAGAGYRLRYLDLDNGIDILRNFLTDPSSPYVKENPEVGKNLESVVSVTETRKSAGGKLSMQRAEVWPRVSSLLEKWIDNEGKEFGSIADWTPAHVLCVGSFTRLAESALRFVQGMNGRLNAHPYQSDYGDAQGLLRSFLEIVTDSEVRCNVILECHIDSMELSGIQQEFPRAIGQKLSPVMGSYFNTLLEIKKTGYGANMKRVINTVPTATLGVKNTAPFRVPSTYDLHDGLAQYFAAVRGVQ